MMIIFLVFFNVINCEILSVIGYSQDVHYSKIYRAELLPNGTITAMQLLSFAPGCHDDCPNFYSVFDPYGLTVYLRTTFGSSPDIVNAFAIMQHDSLAVDFPENVTAMFFIGNGTAYYLQDNSNSTTNSYTIMNWNAYNDTSVFVASLPTTPYSFYRACFFQNTLYAIDRDQTTLITWQFSSFQNSTVTTQKIIATPQWVNTIESLSWYNDGHKVAAVLLLDRNGTVWTIESFDGHPKPFMGPYWPAFKSHAAANQLVVSPFSMSIYYIGYDVSLNSYVMFTGSNSPTPLQGGLYGLQWICLTSFSK